MIRYALLCSAALLAAPLSAQDHSSHTGQEPKPEMDHCAMGHLPPEQCPPKEAEAPLNHSDHTMAPEPQEAKSAESPPEMDHSAHMMTPDKAVTGAAPESAVPARAFEGPRHAADGIWGAEVMAPSRKQLARENGAMKTGMVLIERFEARISADGGETAYLWDAQGWYGGDTHRLVIKTEGEGAFGGEIEDAEIQALYSRAVGPFFDLQAGIRFDPEPDTRSHLVVGVQGLAPYMAHVDGALFLSDRGDLTARIEGEYDQKITQQLILQPRIEVEFSAQDIPERDIAAGITKVEPGIRLRYEITPEFAPYIGVEYETKTGGTADLARGAGEDPDGLKVLIGMRAWF